MTLNGLLQVAIYILVLLAIIKPLGIYMTKVFSGEKTFLERVFGPIERLISRICSVSHSQEALWTVSTAAMLMSSLLSPLVLYAMQGLQYSLPLNPQQFTGLNEQMAFNTAASFTTNTNWQD